jgi:hypothetical protein
MFFDIINKFTKKLIWFCEGKERNPGNLQKTVHALWHELS